MMRNEHRVDNTSCISAPEAHPPIAQMSNARPGPRVSNTCNLHFCFGSLCQFLLAVPQLVVAVCSPSIKQEFLPPEKITKTGRLSAIDLERQFQSECLFSKEYFTAI